MWLKSEPQIQQKVTKYTHVRFINKYIYYGKTENEFGFIIIIHLSDGINRMIFRIDEVRIRPSKLVL